MKDSVKESLSALMDGEVSELELRRLLNSDDSELRAAWASLHRSQQLLHDGDLAFVEMDISSRVMTAIEEQPALRAPGSGWRQALAGFAVAASVATVVVFAGSERMIGASSAMFAAKDSAPAISSGRVYPAQMSSATGGVAVSAAAGALPTMSPAQRSEADKRFDALLRKHTERASLNSGQGFVSYARVVPQESK